MPEGLSRRSYSWRTEATHWREIWEAGPYYARVSEALESARRYAVIAGWQIDSRLPLPRPGLPDNPEAVETLRAKLIRLCQMNDRLEIFLLIWDHAYFYMAERELWQGRIWENIHPRVHFVFDNRHPFGASHHEKLCVVDGEVAFCGGIDLCDERWDSPEHLYEDARRSLDLRAERHGPYHDLAVEVRGPVCDILLSQLGERWRRVCNIPFPSPGPPPQAAPGAAGRVYVSRTEVGIEAGAVSGRIRREVEFLFRDLIARAEHRIILEGQYYWSLLLHDVLRSKIAAMRGHPGFEIILLVAELESVNSPTRRMAAFEARLLRDLEIAAGLAGIRLRTLAPRAFRPGRPPRPIYVHSKILVVDDRYVSIGSTNLASRALRLDTETHLTREARTPDERRGIRELAERMLSHWGIDGRTPGCPSEARAVSFLPGQRLAVRRGALGPRWEALFDPAAPLFYTLKRRLRRIPGAALMVFWGLTAGVPAWVLAPADISKIPFSGAALILSASCWIPLPYLALLLVARIGFGLQACAVLLWLTYLNAAFWGYGSARIHESRAWHRLSGRHSKSALSLAGSRTFGRFLQLSLEPRFAFRSKFAAAGLYHLPIPWFVWIHGMVLPCWLSLLIWAFGRMLNLR